MTGTDLRSTLRLTTFGSASLLSIDATGASGIVLRPGKPLALLIYLAASPAHAASREHLLNLLWADAEPERGLRTLRQTVFQLRQTLGENAIESTGRELTLSLPLQFDRDDFLAAVARGDAESAVSLYKGPFLADFGVPGGAEFEHWADRERDRLQSAYIRSAESLIRSKLDHAQRDRAIAEARRLRDFDPDRESAAARSPCVVRRPRRRCRGGGGSRALSRIRRPRARKSHALRHTAREESAHSSST